MSSDNDEDNFYFESDHLALRGNRDYSNLLRTIAVLESQKVRAHQHLEELVLAKKRYLEDPELMLQKLRKNEEIITPNYMNIAKLPEIGQYDSMPAEIIKIKQEPGEEADKQTKVRGRVLDETKPGSFNQLWTCEEQRRLEELLIEYPAEEFESRRYAKIAKALGNRTPQQVCSRVQKYFLKLHNAGMPIPGRKPKIRRSGNTKIKNLYRPSTFFPAFNVPVHMPDDDDFKTDLCNLQSPQPTADDEDSADNADSHASAPKTQDTKQRTLFMLKIIRDEKSNAPDGYNPDPMAVKCEACNLAPISITRWRCNSCYTYINQCNDCLINQLLTHKFEHIAHDVFNEQET